MSVQQPELEKGTREVGEYTGPPLMPGRLATWVPLVARQLPCDCKKCHRMGICLKVARAATIHGFQGLQVGPGEVLTRMIGHCDAKAEARCNNLRYVMGARGKGASTFMMGAAMTLEELVKCGSGKAAEMLRDEEQRIRGLAAVERGRYSEALGHFKAALEVSDSVGPAGFAGGPWSHREQVLLDIVALQQWEAKRR